MKQQATNALGQRIRELRKIAGWTQELLADRAGLDRSHISLLEAGKRDATLGTLQRIAAALHVPVDELLSGSAGEIAGAGNGAVGQRELSPEVLAALRRAQLNLFVLAELDAEKLETLAIEIAALRQAAERKAREERGGVHSSRKARRGSETATP